MLAEIAAPGQIAAVSIYSHQAESASAPLAWAKKLPALGTGAEEIIAARPALVLTGNLVSSGTNAALAKAGIRTVAVGVAASVAEDIAQIRTIAEAIGGVEAGEALIRRMEKALGRPPTRADKSAIIWQSGGFVAGAGTLQDELLSAHGFANASKTYALKNWDMLPLETLIRNPPDVIFMPVSGKGEDARKLAARQRLLRHVGNRTRVVALPDRLLFCGGPTIIEVSKVFARTREELQ